MNATMEMWLRRLKATWTPFQVTGAWISDLRNPWRNGRTSIPVEMMNRHKRYRAFKSHCVPVVVAVAIGGAFVGTIYYGSKWLQSFPGPTDAVSEADYREALAAVPRLKECIVERAVEHRRNVGILTYHNLNEMTHNCANSNLSNTTLGDQSFIEGK